MQQEEALRISQAAKVIGMSVSWLYKQCEAGLFPHLKIGRAVRFDPQTLREWKLKKQRDVLSGVS